MPADITASAVIKHKGSPIGSGGEDALLELSVTRALNSAASCMLRFDPNSFDVSKFKLDDEIEIGASVGGTTTTVFKGLVRSVSIDLVDTGVPDAVIECYDKACKFASLSIGKTFLKKTLSDVVSTIAKDAGLGAQVEALSVQFDYQVYPGTALDALDEIVRRTGYVWLVEDGKLHFKRPFTKGSVTLDPDENLARLRARMTGVDQAKEVQVKGWDPAAGQEILGTTKTPKRTGQTAPRAKEASDTFRKKSEIDYAVASRAAANKADADAMAAGILDQRTTSGIHGWGETVIVEPGLAPGTTVKVESVTSAWVGDYPISRVEHVWGPDRTFHTRFDIGPPDMPTSTSGSVGGLPAVFDHLTIGVVTEVRAEGGEAPDVKVTLPYLTAAAPIVSNWARVIGLGAGKNMGFLAIPEVDDEVVVGFENGDPTRPFVLGGLWSAQKLPEFPPEEIDKGGIQTRSFHTRKGHSWTFTDDKVGSRTSGYRVELNNGAFLEMNIDEVLLDSAKKPIKITGGSGAKIEIDAQGNITLQGASITLKADQTVKVESGTNLDVKAGTALKATAATQAEMSGNAGTKVTSSAIVEVKGTMVKIN